MRAITINITRHLKLGTGIPPQFDIHPYILLMLMLINANADADANANANAKLMLTLMRMIIVNSMACPVY